MNDLEIAAKFREAARYLVTHGWTQGSWGRDGGPACAEGALEMVCAHYKESGFRAWLQGLVAGPELSRLRLGHRLKTIAAERVGGCLWIWNDNPFGGFRRDAAEVIGLFEGLAHDLELRHQIRTGKSSKKTCAPVVMPASEEPVLNTETAVGATA